MTTEQTRTTRNDTTRNNKNNTQRQRQQQRDKANNDATTQQPIPPFSAKTTTGCLIKGAYAMLPTLRLFLEEDNHYNVTRASLMLAATRACVLSIDSEAVLATMGEGYNINVKSSPSGEDLVWLVRCLLWVGVARDSLKDTLLLLNAIVPDVLRN